MIGEPVGKHWAHVCVDMQMLFAPGSEWGLEWMPRVVPNVVRLCEANPARSIFTRFIPARRADEAGGRWRDYYRRWHEFTLDEEGRSLIAIVPELRGFSPPAPVVDKAVYSPWFTPPFVDQLRRRQAATIVVSGGETDMCVLATVLGAIDWGYRVILVEDAVCSASDTAHDAILAMFQQRYRQHVETISTRDLLDRISQG